MYIRKQVIFGFFAVVILVVFIGTFLATSVAAQQPYAGSRWEYKELGFNQPVSFGSTLANGYFQNGTFIQPENPDLTVAGLFHYFGREGWELVSTTNNQFFILKRQLLE